MNSTGNLSYDVFLDDPPPQDNDLLPNGEPQGGSPVASTLLYGSKDAVLTHGHGGHWLAAGHADTDGNSAICGVGEHGDGDIAQMLVAGWL